MCSSDNKAAKCFFFKRKNTRVVYYDLFQVQNYLATEKIILKDLKSSGTHHGGGEAGQGAEQPEQVGLTCDEKLLISSNVNFISRTYLDTQHRRSN